MESSLNSSPESTASGLKSVFKKPGDFYQAFEVSMEESVTVTQSNRSDLGLDASSATTNEALPFKKFRKSLQHLFNVSSSESVVNNESEQSVTSNKPKALFTNRNKSLEDYFNVSFNETNSQASVDVEDSVTTTSNKTNPFKKKSGSQKEIAVGIEPSTQVSVDNGADDPSEELHLHSPSHQSKVDEEEPDTSVFVAKVNPFKKSMRPENVSASKISITGESNINENLENENATVNNSRVSGTENLSIYDTRGNPFKQKKSTENSILMMSINKVRSIKSPETNDILNEPTQNSRNMTLSKSISKLTSNTSYFEQSSINDDNLNNWMSDQSDEEMPPPTVPSVTSRLSSVKEKQAVLDIPTENINSLSVWEQKLNEILSNAEKKSTALKLKTTSASPRKVGSLKKSKVNIDKSGQLTGNTVNRFKPPKLLKPASYATKQLYAHIIKKLKPKYGIDTLVEAENLVLLMCDTVKKVTQRKTHQKKLIQNLKNEMAKAGLIETTVEFYEFIIKFLPYRFRVKVIPCLQPVTNIVYPPKDVANLFDKVL